MSERYYVSVSQAKKLLGERKFLQQDVERFWQERNIAFPQSLQTKGRAVLARQVPTFRLEDGIFVLMAESAGLEPTWFAYEGDKFITNSKAKRTLVRPALTSSVDKHGALIKRVHKLVKDPGQWHGRRLGELQAEDGEFMVNWHRQRLLQAVPDATIVDMSDACKAWGGRAAEYYTALLSLFVAHAVLFEDYHGGESGELLEGFTGRVFEPAVEEVERLFGVKPIIVPLPWWPDLALHPEKDWLRDWRSCPALVQS